MIEPIVLPKDNGPHENTIEWWYFNGHLQDTTGREYSFMDCFFKVDCLKVNIEHLLNNPLKNLYQKGEYVYFAHSVVSDILKKKNYKDIQNISFVSHDSFLKNKLFISYTNPSIFGGLANIIEEQESNGFHLQTENLDLTLESKKDPLLEGGHGYVGTPESGSYYYSLTDLQVKGFLNINNQKIEVHGQAWMDHQWANAVYKKDKWTWFSFQLENGTEIMCVEYETKNGTDILINTLTKDGVQGQYKKAVFTKGTSFWKSRKTKAKYPMVWKIKIPEASISIKTRAILRDQEMIFGPINYWEGPMEVQAKINGVKIKGKGFMELVGYPSDYNYLLLAGEELEENIFRKIKNFFRLK